MVNNFQRIAFIVVLEHSKYKIVPIHLINYEINLKNGNNSKKELKNLNIYDGKSPKSNTLKTNVAVCQNAS